MTPDWDEVSFIISSTYRVAVLERLAIGPATPSQIANDAEISISHVSRALGRLRERSLVKLLVSEDRQKGRVYGITEQGTEIWETIEDENLI
jgi:DNA-binding MarR family transcriptional regulator